jgi:hypothetical protein
MLRTPYATYRRERRSTTVTSLALLFRARQHPAVVSMGEDGDDVRARRRIVATAALFLTLVPAIPLNGIVYLVTFPFFAAVVLREIWAKGWFVPEDGPPRVEGSRVDAEDTAPSEPITVSKVVRWGAPPLWRCSRSPTGRSR